MAVADILPDAIASVATALGILDADGNLDSAFFDHPLNTVGAMLRQPARREALADALSVLLGSAASESSATGERRRYPLVKKDACEVVLAVDLARGIAGPDLTVSVCFGGTLKDDADGVLTFELDVPLVRGAGTALQAICGKADDGPIILRFDFAMADGVTVTATAAAHDGGGWLAARVAGVVIDGTPIAPFEVRSDRLSAGALELFHRLFAIAAALLSDGTGDVGRVLTNLPRLLGFADPAHVMPVAGLLAGTARWRDWFAGLAAGGAKGLRTWLDGVAGFLDVALEAGDGPPTPAAPWTVPLHVGLPNLDLTVAVAPDDSGTSHLRLGVRAQMAAPAPADARVQAEVIVVDLPLAGAAAERWFASGRVVAVAPNTDKRRLVPPGPIDPHATPPFAVGRITTGVRWGDSTVEPLLELEDVVFHGNFYGRLDLSDADALADSAKEVLEGQLRDLLGTSPAAEALLVICGLEPTAGHKVDLGLLATAPTRAIAEHHLALLDAGVWHGAGGPLYLLAALLGVDAATPLEGAGTADDPWKLALVEDGLRLALTASSSVDGTRQLELGLRVESPPGARAPIVMAELALLSVRFATPVQARPLDSVQVKIGAKGVIEGPVTATSSEIGLGWSASNGIAAYVGLRGAAVELIGEDGEPAPLELGDVRLLPWTFDPAAADLGLGLDPAALPSVAEWSARRFAATLDPLPGALVSGLADAAQALLGDPPRLERLASDPGAVARAVLCVVAAQAGSGADSALLAALSGVVAGAAGALFDGTGAPGAPWRWVPDPEAADVALTGWLAPFGPMIGPPSIGAGEAGEEATDLDPTGVAAAAAVDALIAAAGVDSELAGLAACRDFGALADALAALGAYCASGDGLVPGAALGVPAGWGAGIVAAAPATAPFGDAAALTAVADEVDNWASAPRVLVNPAWWPPSSWWPLVAELAGRHPDWKWAEVDLRRDPLAALATIEAADAYVVVAGEDPGQHVPPVLDRIAALRPGRAPGLVAVDPGTELLGWAARHSAASAGLITVGLRLAGDADTARWTALADAVRIAEPLLADHPTWGGLVAVWRELGDGHTAPDDGRPDQVGRLRPADLATPATLPDLGPLPRRALAASADGEALLRALADAIAIRASQIMPPTALVSGVGAAVPLPASSGPVRGSVRTRLDLAHHAFGTAAPSAPATLVVDGALERTDGGWLAGPPSATQPASVRRMVFHATVPLGAPTDATVRLELQDASLGGVRHAACTPDDAGFATLFTTVLDALPAGDAHVDAALGLAADHLGVVVRAGQRWQLDTAGLDRLLAEPGKTLATRVHALLAGARLLGFTADPTAPQGVQRLVRTLSPALNATLDPSAGKLRLTTVGDGIALGPGATLRFDAVADLADGTVSASWALSGAGVTVERTSIGVVQLRLPDDPATPIVLGPVSDAAAISARLVRRLPPVLGSSLASGLLEAATGVSVGPAVLLPWLVDPPRTLADRVRGGGIVVVAIEIARALGLAITPASAVTLLPGVLELTPVVDSAGVELVAATPSGGWSPAVGMLLDVAGGLRFDSAGVAAPAGRVGVKVDLPHALGSSGWAALGIQVAYDAAGARVSLLADDARIDLVPRFSGYSILGLVAERFLPQVLDALDAALPASPLKQKALGVASALEVYGPTFAGAPAALRDLTLARLRARASPLATALCKFVQDALASASGTTVAVTPLSDGVQATLAPVAGGKLDLTITVDAELSLTLALSQLSLPPPPPTPRPGQVTGGVTVTATSSPTGVALSGSATVGLDLEDALRIKPGPQLSLSLTPSGTVTATILPLPDQPAEAAINLLPAPAVVLSPAARSLMAERWLAAPALDLLLRLMGDRGVLGTAIVTGGPTWTQVLEDGGLLEGGRARVPLQPASLPGAALAFANAVEVQVAEGLLLRVVRDPNGRVGVGVGLTGTVPVRAGGDVAPTVLLGDVDTGGTSPSGGAAVIVVRGSGTSWLIEPELRLGRVGVGATGPLGRPLLGAGPLSLDAVEGRLDLTAALAIGGGVTVSGKAAELSLRGIGLPGLSGSGAGDNAVAASLLAPAAARRPRSALSSTSGFAMRRTPVSSW